MEDQRTSHSTTHQNISQQNQPVQQTRFVQNTGRDEVLATLQEVGNNVNDLNAFIYFQNQIRNSLKDFIKYFDLHDEQSIINLFIF
jgi:hypothetical protein